VTQIQEWHHQHLTAGYIERHTLVCIERLSKKYSTNKGVVFPGELYVSPGNEGSPHTRQGPPLSITDFFVRASLFFVLQSSIVVGRSSNRVVLLRGSGGLSHERVHGGKDLRNKWECWAHNTSITMPQPDDKLRGSLCRSLEQATLISSPSTIILIEFSTMSNAKGVLIIMNHH